jgi:hypothetical protein
MKQGDLINSPVHRGKVIADVILADATIWLITVQTAPDCSIFFDIMIQQIPWKSSRYISIGQMDFDKDYILFVLDPPDIVNAGK